MTLHQIDLFLAICNQGSLTAAAEQLHITPPSISVAIKQLEEEFNLRLFYRSKKRLILTDEGKDFQNRASEIMERVNTLREHMKNQGEHLSKIRLGIPAMASIYLYPKLISSFCKQYPSIQIETHESSSLDSAQLLRNDMLDIAIVLYDEGYSGLFDYTPLLEMDAVGCVKKDHPLAYQTNVTAAMLKDERLIFGGRKSKTTRGLLQRFADAGVEPNIFMHSSQVLFVMQIVEQYNGVAFFMEDLLKLNDNLAPFSLDPKIRYSLGIIRRKDIPLSSDKLKFLKFCDTFVYT